METIDVEGLRQQVLWAAFVVSALFGAVAQRTHFCTMGAISDAYNIGDRTRLRMWALAVGVAIIGFHGMAALGWIDPRQSIYTSGRVIWLSALVGGALFGFGMVLASGCGSKTLIRLSAGSLKALVVFAVMGIASFATLRGITAVLRNATVDRVAFEIPSGSAVSAWLPTALGQSGASAALVVALVLGGALIAWALADRDFRSGVDNWLAGLGIGASVLAMWWVTGRLGFLPEHPETLEPVFLGTQSGRMESLTFTAPMAHAIDWLIFYSDKSKLLTVGVVSVAGVLVGGCVQALASRSFHWEGFAGTRDTALHIVGAVCMGVGGVTAMGCTVGQGLSGLSTLSLTSLIAVVGIFAGAIAGFRFQNGLLARG